MPYAAASLSDDFPDIFQPTALLAVERTTPISCRSIRPMRKLAHLPPSPSSTESKAEKLLVGHQGEDIIMDCETFGYSICSPPCRPVDRERDLGRRGRGEENCSYVHTHPGLRPFATVQERGFVKLPSEWTNEHPIVRIDDSDCHTSAFRQSLLEMHVCEERLFDCE